MENRCHQKTVNKKMTSVIPKTHYTTNDAEASYYITNHSCKWLKTINYMSLRKDIQMESDNKS